MKATRKILSVILAILMLCIPTSVAFAKTTQDEAPKTMVGYLTSDTGETFEVIGHLVEDSVSTYGLNDDEHSATYEFDTRGTGTVTEDGVDKSISVHAYLTVNYSTKLLPKRYLLTSVSGYWDIIDMVHVTVEDAQLRFGCIGYTDNGYIDNQVRYMKVNNNFSVSTGFNTYVENIKGDSCGANLTLTIRQRTGTTHPTWLFTLTNNIYEG